MDCTSCNDTLLPDQHGNIDAAKIILLGDSHAALRAVLEPLSDEPVRAVRLRPTGRHAAPVPPAPILVARLPLASDLLLYVFGAIRPAESDVLSELLHNAIGTIFLGAERGPEEVRRIAELGMATLPWLVTPEAPAPVAAGVRAIGRVSMNSVGLTHRVIDRGERTRAKQPLTAIVQHAIDDRRDPHRLVHFRHR